MECPICQEIFKNPTTLPCGHTFCMKCLALCKSICAFCRQEFNSDIQKPNYILLDIINNLNNKTQVNKLKYDYSNLDIEPVTKSFQKRIMIDVNVPIYGCSPPRIIGYGKKQNEQIKNVDFINNEIIFYTHNRQDIHCQDPQNNIYKLTNYGRIQYGKNNIYELNFWIPRSAINYIFMLAQKQNFSCICINNKIKRIAKCNCRAMRFKSLEDSIYIYLLSIKDLCNNT